VAALAGRSLSRAASTDPGFDRDNVAFLSVYPEMSGYDDERAGRFFRRLSQSLVEQGVATSTALADRLPLDMYGSQSDRVTAGDTTHVVQMARVGAGYFETMGVAVTRGRSFEARDEQPGSDSAIVSAAAARAFWPGRDPVGQRLQVGDRAATVIGVAGDTRVQTLSELPQPFVYLPIQEHRAKLLRLLVRTNGDADAVVGRIRRAVFALDPAVAIFEARSMRDYLELMLYPYRVAAALAAVLGMFALVLAGIGLYGVLACGVAERLRELAIRIALGAAPSTIVRSAAADPFRATLIGLAAGALLSLAAGRLLSSMLFGISAVDPAALAITAGVVCLVIAGASAGPIRRALHVDPISILRE
jgi:putative ABC transport system permease protein